MASVKPLEITNLIGGMNTADPTVIEDNQFADLLNMFYDLDGILTTRRGSETFGEAIPDAVMLLNAADATTNWVASDDANTIATGTAIRGTFALSFAITASGTTATVTNASLGSINIGAANDYLRFWLFVPTGFNTDLTNVKIRLGSDSTNYYEWTLGTLTENTSNFISLAIADATTTGTPNEASINYFRWQASYPAAYANQAGIRLDSIYTYGNTSASAIHSLQTHKKSTGTRYLIAGAAGSIFEYRETQEIWEVIKTGLTSGKRFSSAMFKDVMYITNGTDNYMSYNGVLVSEHAGVEKGKYITVANDVGVLSGVAADASTVFYTNANPTDFTSFPNFEPVNEDDGQIITGARMVGPLLIAFKERSNYIINLFSTPVTISTTDYDGGCKSDRSIVRVENDTYFLSENGITSLAQREGTSGAVRGSSMSDNIRNNLRNLSNRNLSCATYWPKTSNYYFAIDDENSGQNRTVYVRSIKAQGAWTRWKGVNANEFCIWTDSSDVEHLLIANPYGGQVVELETGFTDQGNPIEWRITTKTYDFNQPGRLVVYERADFGGFHSEQSTAEATVAVVNVSEVTKTKTISYSATKDGTGNSVLSTLGNRTLGSTPLGGSGIDELAGDLTLYPFYRYMPLYFTGRYAAAEITGNADLSAFALTKLSWWPIGLSKDTVPQGLYI